MIMEDGSMEDIDAPLDNFRGATLQIQHDNETEAEITCLASAEEKAVACLPAEDEVSNLFSSRDGIVEQSVELSVNTFLKPGVDGDLVGSWVLTEISIWDAEKERIVLLTTNSILVIKFDFIALKALDVHRTFLHDVDTLVYGDLVYPSASLVPRLNGLASGLSTVVKGCLLRWSHPPEICQTAVDVSQFEPRSRNAIGLRIMWNKGKPVTFSKKWNPFSSDIPFITFTSHPLLHHRTGERKIEQTKPSYDVETLLQKLVVVIEQFNSHLLRCSVQYKPILLDNYLALGSLIHNRNSLGFFKVRGRFSF